MEHGDKIPPFKEIMEIMEVKFVNGDKFPPFKELMEIVEENKVALDLFY